jgi:hypothetical protein
VKSLVSPIVEVKDTHTNSRSAFNGIGGGRRSEVGFCVVLDRTLDLVELAGSSLIVEAIGIRAERRSDREGRGGDEDGGGEDMHRVGGVMQK